MQIKRRYTGAVLFEGGSGISMRDALERATKSGADLSGADLRDADLSGADLHGKKLVGKRPYFQVGPIGSRSDYLQAFITDSGLTICTGCFFDTIDQFEIALLEEHGDNEHAKEYTAALVLIRAHAELWAPVEEAKREEVAA